jgi:addiction module RelE/StbE family toxin
VIKITWDHSFKRIYKKKIKSDNDLRNRFWTAIELFSKDPFSHRLRTHKLTGKLEGLWAFSVTYECRVIFEFLSKNEVLLIDIGGHDEVY